MQLSYSIAPFEFACLDLPVDEVELGRMTMLSCAHDCIRHASCLMFRYRMTDENCSIIIEGTGRISDSSHLYKIV